MPPEKVNADDDLNDKIFPCQCMCMLTLFLALLIMWFQVFEDIMQDYAQKTVTIEPHPHTGRPHASIHPCQHGAAMKRVRMRIYDTSLCSLSTTNMSSSAVCLALVRSWRLWWKTAKCPVSISIYSFF